MNQRKRLHDIPERELNGKQRLAIILARVFSQIARIIPLPVGYMIADRVGDLLYWRSREYRLNVIDNLRQVHRGDIGEMLLRRQARMVFRTSSRNFWDLLRVPHLNVERFYTNILLPVNDWSVIDNVRDAGKGGIIVTGHFGAFDVVGQTLYMRGYNPFTLTAPTVGEFVYTGVNYLRESHGAPLEDLSPSAIRRMMRVIRSGGLVGMVADRDYTDMGMSIPFFGRETTLPSGPVRLARATGAPIVPVFAVRGDDDGREERYAFHILDPMHIGRTDDAEQDVVDGMLRLAAVYERHYSLNPEQWVMFQRVWPDESPRRRRVRTSRRHAALQSDAPDGTSAGDAMGTAGDSDPSESRSAKPVHAGTGDPTSAE